MSRMSSVAGLRVSISVAMLTAVMFAAPWETSGAYVDWDPISGNGWELATNWVNATTSLRTLPTGSDIPCIGRLGANCEQPCVVTADGTVGGSDCYIAINNKSGHLRILSGSLTIGNELRLCYNGLGVADVVQSNGSLSAGGSINIASSGAAGQQGSYDLEGGTLSCVGDMNIAGTGPGSFVQRGGTNSPARLFVGYGAGVYTGTYQLINGKLQSGVSAVGEFGRGILTISGGTYVNNGGFFMGYFAGGHGTLLMNGGSFILSTGWSIGGDAGASTGIVQQTGGTIRYGGDLLIGNAASATGRYELAGGVLSNSAGDLYVGNSGSGSFLQTGGTNHVTGLLRIGAGTSPAVYDLLNGVVDAGQLYIGVNVSGNGSSGTLNMGNATNTGSIRLLSTVMTMRYLNADACTLHGWGTISASGAMLTMNGRVVADGYGIDRTLDMSSLTAVIRSSYTFTSTNGWFAQSHGRLRLPDRGPFIGATGNPSWGDNDNSATLVNSVNLALTNVTGTLTGALLATDHGSAIGGLVKPIAAWDFSGITFSTCGLTIRYDDPKAVSLGIADADLKVVQYVNGVWRNITGSVNPGTKTITANAISPITQIAVASDILPRGTVVKVR